MDIQEISTVIRSAFDSFGMDIILDHTRFNAILMDYLPNHPKERKLINSVLTEGIGKDLYGALSKTSSEQQFVIRKCINQLIKEAWFSETASIFAVSGIASALGLGIIEVQEQKEETKEAPERILSKNAAQALRDVEAELSQCSAIGYKAFSGDTRIKKLSVPRNITRIYSRAFYNCINLTSVELHGAITAIGNEAFAGCDSLQHIVLQNNPRYAVVSGKFYEEFLIDKEEECLLRVVPVSKEILYLPSEIKRIGPRAFESCSLTTICLPKDVETIARTAFYRCRDLSFLRIEQNSIFKSVYGVLYSADGKSLLFYPSGRKDKNYIIEDSTVEIAASAFENASWLEIVTIPASVKTIGDNAFRNCVNLSRIILPSSVKRIGERGFQGCTSLIDAILPRDITEIGDFAFAECTSLDRIYVPHKVIRIGNAAFCKCSALQKVVILENVKEIGLNAFDDCSADLVVKIRRNPYMEDYCKAHRIKYEKI